MSQAIAQHLRAQRAELPGVWERPSNRLVMLFGALLCLGLVMVASTAALSRDGNVASAVLRRLLWMGAGAAAFALGCTVDYQRWRRHHVALLAAALGLLAAVLLPGIGARVNGASRWIRLSRWIGVQPSEFAKLALLVWLAAYCERRLQGRGRSRGPDEMQTVFRGFLVPVGVAGAVSALVLLEPDFGTAVLIGVVSVAVLLVCGTRPLHVLVAGAASLPLLHKLVLGCPYRLERVATFLDPWRDPMGSGYQLVQSLIAIGSGGPLGKGLGTGAMGFLPAARNDFIMSTVAEQLGFVGAAVVILAFSWIVLEGLKVTLRARDRFGFALACGITTLIGLQAVVHMAVVTGSVPTKGLSLPFVSAGGSSLFFTMWAAGILVNIARSEEAPDRFRITPWYRDVPGYEHALRRLGRQAAGLLLAPPRRKRR